jgi:hypothetical protein
MPTCRCWPGRMRRCHGIRPGRGRAGRPGQPSACCAKTGTSRRRQASEASSRRSPLDRAAARLLEPTACPDPLMVRQVPRRSPIKPMQTPSSADSNSAWSAPGSAARSAASRTRSNERQDAREDPAELAPAPRIDEPSNSLHRVPQRFRRPDQVLCRRRFDIKRGADSRDDLAARFGWQISKRVPVHGHRLCTPRCIRAHPAAIRAARLSQIS